MAKGRPAPTWKAVEERNAGIEASNPRNAHVAGDRSAKLNERVMKGAAARSANAEKHKDNSTNPLPALESRPKLATFPAFEKGEKGR
jgi:hypothetical protein